MTRPFGRISLGLSGGGTRAAGYHLGVLGYLDRMGLLPDVAVISGASGGGFVTSTYAMSQAKGQSFEQYNNWMLDKLRRGRMAEWVLDNFANRPPRGHAGRRTVISSLAEAYNTHFFEDFKFGEFLKRQANGGWEPVGHLEEVIINATDFRSGLGFRFQLNAPAGNGQSPIDPERLRHARLADVMASSSCLPGGMEPFFFPEDFVWEGAEAVRDFEALRDGFREKGVDAVPLMDGGLYDNQGLEAMMQAATRIRWEDGDSVPDPGLAAESEVFWGISESQRFEGEFDLLFQQIAAGKVPKDPPGVVIISDAVSEADPIFRAGYAAGQTAGGPLRTLAQPPDKGLRLSSALWAWWILVLLTGATALVVGVDLFHLMQQNDWKLTNLHMDEVPGLTTLNYLVPILLAAAVFVALVVTRRTVREVLAAVDQILETEGRREADPGAAPSTWSFLRRLRIAHLPWLVHIRIAALMSVVGDIFFVRHRILGYSLLYGFPGWRRQLLSAEIFSLSVVPPMDAPTVSPNMKAVGELAAKQPTAFWYDKPHQLEELVATGQMCMCRNLIVFLRRRLREKGGANRTDLQKLLSRAEADWARFTENPVALVPRAARPTQPVAKVEA